MQDRFKFRVWNDMQKCYSADDHYISEDGFINTIGDYVLEQCTGLKDKNGKLIYEGDIVATQSSSGVYYDKGVVKYGEFNCSCCDGVYGWYFDNGDIRSYEYYEVIGNIHQEECNDM